MNTKEQEFPGQAEALRRELLHLARQQDELACTEGAAVPYWAPTPPSVRGHRSAAVALREAADRVVGWVQVGQVRAHTGSPGL
jgi:hypothetical protein